MTTSKLTLAAVRAELRAIGITINKEHDEYRVNIRDASEASACYETDLAAALATGKAMAFARDKQDQERAESSPLPEVDSVMITKARSGGISIVPTVIGCIVMRQIGVTVYKRNQVPVALEAIRRECVLPAHLVERIETNWSILALPVL